MSENKLEKLLTTLSKADTILQNGKGLITDEFVRDFTSHYHTIKENAKEILNPDRCIRVGIIGQVKAGKSSFLNALLFEGKDILPKAATPMTAGLTKIVYSSLPYAKVEFYSDSEWNDIEDGAREYNVEFEKKCRELIKIKNQKKHSTNSWGNGLKSFGSERSIDNKNVDYVLTENDKILIRDKIDKKLSAYKELVDMVRKNSDSTIYNKLGKEEKIEFAELVSYIGSNGKYAPLVKSVEIGLNFDGLENLEIVDTPGMGDPVVSRSMKTKDFLVNCDLVILVSRASQFMEQEDIKLLVQALPENAVRGAAIVASKFDSALMDTPRRKERNKSFMNVFRDTVSKLEESAKNQLRENIKSTASYRTTWIVEQLLEKANIRFTSGLLFSASKKMEKGEMLSEEEQHVINNLKSMFRDMDFSSGFLSDLSGIDAFREQEFYPIAEKKEEVLQERRREFVDNQTITFIKKIESVCSEARSGLHQLEAEDLESIQEKKKAVIKAADKLRSNVVNEFESCKTDISWRLRKLKGDVSSLSSSYNELETKKETKTHHRHVSHLIRKDEHWDEIEEYYTSSISGVLDNIHGYIDEAGRLITTVMNNAIDINDVKIKIKDIVVEKFMESGADFEPSDIERPVQLLLERLMIPPFQFVEYQPYERKIIERFGDSCVRDEKIHSLKSAQTEILGEIKNEYLNIFQELENNIHKTLDIQSCTFVDNVSKHIIGKLEILDKNLNDEEKSIDCYKKFIRSIEATKQELIALVGEDNVNMG